MNLARLIVLLLAVYVTCAPQSNVDRYVVEDGEVEGLAARLRLEVVDWRKF